MSVLVLSSFPPHPSHICPWSCAKCGNGPFILIRNFTWVSNQTSNYQNSVSIFILCIFHFHQMKQGGFTDWAMRILRSPWLSADVVSASCYHHSIGYGSWEMSSCLGFVIKYLGKGVDLETSLSFSSFLCKIKSWGRCYIASNLSSTSSILLFFYIGLGSLKYASYWLMYWCPLLTDTPQTS